MKSLISILKYSLVNLFKNPVLFIPSSILLIILSLISYFFAPISIKISSNALQIVWSAFYSLISFMIISFFLTILLSLSKSTIRKLNPWLDIKHSLRNSYLTNLLLILAISILFALATYISIYLGGLLAGYNKNLGLYLFLLILLSFLAGVFIFLTFSNLYCVIYSESFRQSINKSIFLVKRNYFSVLSITISFFLLNELVNTISNDLLSESIKSILILPFMALFLSKFLIDSEKR